MSQYTTSDFYGDYAEERAGQRVHEPTGMTASELLDWYLAQPQPFRRKHLARISELATGILIGNITAALEQIYVDEVKRQQWASTLGTESGLTSGSLQSDTTEGEVA